MPLPPVPGLADADASLCGLVISHPHLDHYGLLGKVASEVPVYVGGEAESLLRAAGFFCRSRLT